MNVINSNAGFVPVHSIQRHPDNPRMGDLSAVRASIKSNGFYGFVVAQRSSGYILVGNHRFEAAVQEGALEIPCVWLDVDDDRAKRIMLADNRTSDIGGYDDEKLALLLDGLKVTEVGLIGTGYNDADLAELLAKLTPKEDGFDTEDEFEGKSDQYSSQWLILIECKDEAAQVALLDRLIGEGVQCKAMNR